MPQVHLKFDGSNDEQLTPAIKGFIQDVRVDYAQTCELVVQDADKGLGRTILGVSEDRKEVYLYTPRDFCMDLQGNAVQAYERFYVDGRPLRVVMKPVDSKNKKPRGTVVIVWSDLHA